MVATVEMSATRTSLMGGGRFVALLLATLLAGCASFSSSNKVSLRLPEASPATARMSAAEKREHLRILATYGGLYDDARIQKRVQDTINRLTAASARPDLKFHVTILNSPAVNAFALPNGHLYITRGLIALANDESELASVLGHEMGHVIAHHAQIREQKARQAALISHVVSDVLSDPQVGALALAKSKLALASFSRAQEFEADAIGIKTSARAGFDPYGAARFLADMQRNADLKSGGHDSSRSADFLSDHPSTPDRVRKALLDAREFSGPGIGARDRNAYLNDLNGMVYGEDPSEGFVRGRRFVHPKLGFTFTAPPGFTLDNTAQAVLGLKDGGGEAMRLDVVAVPAEQSLAQYLELRLDRERRQHEPARVYGQRLSGGHRPRERQGLDVPAVRGALRQRRLPLHLRRQDHDAGGRPHLPRLGRKLPPPEPEGAQACAPVAGEDRHRRRARHGGIDGAPHGGSRPSHEALPRAQRTRPQGEAQARRESKDRGGVRGRRGTAPPSSGPGQARP